jgi:hypothetical protein
MTALVAARERDLPALAAIVSEDRPDLGTGEGLPPSLLADLMGQIRCDVIGFARFDSGRRETSLLQAIPVGGRAIIGTGDPVNWEHYWHCQQCSYPDRSGDQRSIIKISDFYTTGQWHSTGNCGVYQSLGFDHV